MFEEKLERLIEDYNLAEDGLKKVNICISICILSNDNRRFKFTLEYGFEALKLLKNIKDETLLCKIYYLIAISYGMQGQLDNAEVYLSKALEIAKQTQDGYYLARIYHNFSFIEGGRLNIKGSLDYLIKSSQLCELNGYKDLLIENYICMGTAYLHFDNFSVALEYFKKGLKQTSLDTQKARIRYSIGKVYYELGDLTEAYEHFKTAMKIFKKNNDIYSQLPILIHYGYIFLMKKQIDKAKEYAQSALTLSEENGFNTLYSETLLLLGEICIEERNYPEAEVYYRKFLKIEDLIQNINIVISFYEKYINFKKMINDLVDIDFYEKELQKWMERKG